MRPPTSEAIMRCEMTHYLKRQGFQCYREVSIENGSLRTDILAIKGLFPNVKYTAFEVKAEVIHEGENRGLRGVIRQVTSYYGSGYFDEVYVVSTVEGAKMLDELSGGDIKRVNITGAADISETSEMVPDFGVYSVDATQKPSRIECIKLAPSIKRTKQLKLAMGEADHGQMIYEHFAAEKGATIIPEAMIPDTTESDGLRRDNYIDFMVLRGSDDPRRIFENRNHDGYSITGIEVKFEIIKEALEAQLKRYKSSGCFNYLYLAVPESLENDSDVRELVNSLGIGLITISPKGVREQKVSGRIELAHDSVKYGDTFLIGNGARVDSSFSPFYYDKAEEHCDYLRNLSIEKKAEMRSEMLGKTYATEQNATVAIDELYCMFQSETGYRRLYDYDKRGWRIEESD